MIENSLEIIASILMVRFVAMEAIYQRAKWTRSGLRFPIGIGLRIMIRVGGPFLVFVAYKTLQEGVTGVGAIFTAGVALLGLSSVFWEPGEITTSAEGIKQKRFFGLQTKLIPWERAAASCMRSTERIYEILVIGRNGVSISHSQYHVGQDTFLMELERHKVYIQGLAPSRSKR